MLPVGAAPSRDRPDGILNLVVVDLVRFFIANLSIFLAGSVL